MSMHNIPLTEIEEAGLREHGLNIGVPSQTSDAFRQGVAWGLKSAREKARLEVLRTMPAIDLNVSLEQMGILFWEQWYIPASITREYTEDCCPSALWSLICSISDEKEPIYLAGGKQLYFDDEQKTGGEFLLELLEQPGWLITLRAEKRTVIGGEIEMDDLHHSLRRIIYVEDFMQGFELAKCWADELNAQALAS